MDGKGFRTPGSALGLLVLLACRQPSADTAAFPGYPAALAGRDCPPAGAHAAIVVLRPHADSSLDALGTQLRLTLWRSLETLDGGWFASTDSPAAGTGVECDSVSVCAPLEDWRVYFTGFAPDSTLSGVLEVGGKEEPSRRGTFRAAWHSRTVYCI